MKRYNATREGPVLRHRAAGVVLITVLLFIAASALVASAMVTNYQTARQREQEAQLLFVGVQYRNAIRSYYNTFAPDGARALPPTLHALVEDQRFSEHRQHLRELYPDPITGANDWIVVFHHGRVMGVHSRSERAPIKRSGFAPALAALADKSSYAAWEFSYKP